MYSLGKGEEEGKWKMSNWGTLNHHHLPFYSMETFIRAAKNANKTLVICFSNFTFWKDKKSQNKERFAWSKKTFCQFSGRSWIGSYSKLLHLALDSSVLTDDDSSYYGSTRSTIEKVGTIIISMNSNQLRLQIWKNGQNGTHSSGSRKWSEITNGIFLFIHLVYF